jgi:oxygen-independent coproporphyrinogen-3 oxidase
VIYIHIPFCRSFCTYCDFYSEVAARCRKAEEAQQQEEMFGRFADALTVEVGHRKAEITDDVNTLYIGGGTPSVLPLYVYERVLDALKEAGHGGPYEEFTVEVNPEDIVDKGEAYVKGLLALGVNRISMGVQSFDDGILKFMNRRHDSETARRAYAILEAAGVENISIDLIFGLPQLSDAQWQETLDQALSISGSGALPKHISSYQLSVEPGSMLAKLVERGKWEEASDELCMKQYGMLCDALQKAGYRHYEISNFALEGYEAKHNSAYWRHVPYVGLGPGAHSFVGMRRQWNEPDLKKYIEDPTGCNGGEELTDEQLVIERIMLALRTSEGISEAYLREHCDQHELSRALAAGNLEPIENGMVRIPESHFFISDNIIASLI